METKKIQIVICTGTLCHVLGGAELPSLGQHLPDHLKNQVEIKGSPCIKHCKNTDMRPPFVEINGEVIEQASITKILEHLEKLKANDPK